MLIYLALGSLLMQLSGRALFCSVWGVMMMMMMLDDGDYVMLSLKCLNTHVFAYIVPLFVQFGN